MVFGHEPEAETALTDAGIDHLPADSLDGSASTAGPATVAIVGVEGKLASTLPAAMVMVREVLPEAPVVVVCDEVRPGETRLALGAGATGIVLRGSVAGALASCIEASLAGQVCVPRRLARQVEPATLSAREKQILGMVVMGYMNGEIAQQLFVAESTVKSHLSSAFSKLDVRSRNEAVELILDGERGLGVGILGLESEPIAS